MVILISITLWKSGISEPPQFFNPEQDLQQWNPSTDQNNYPPTFLPTTSLSSSSSCPPNDPVRNEQLVIHAYIGLATNPKRVENSFHPDYIQHNPTIADGRDAVIQDPDPIQGVEFMKTAADADLVWTLARLKVFNQSYIAADIFRVECGQIKEHWDVLELEGEKQIRTSGAFIQK